MPRSRRESRQSVDIWPGFVDALSTLLLSVIFLLVVFVLGQFFMGQMLQGRDETVNRLQRSVKDLGAKLELESDAAGDLRRNLQRLTQDLNAVAGDRDDLAGRLSRSEADRAALDQRSRQLTGERLTLERTLADLRAGLDRAQQETALSRSELEDARRTFAADRGKLETQLADLVQLRRDIEALRSLRAQLEGRVAELVVAGAAGEEERRRLLAEVGSERDRGKALEARLASSEERTLLAQRELQGREARIDELVRSVESTEGALNAEAQSKANALADVQRLTTEIETLNRKLGLLDSQLTGQEEDIAQKNRQIADLGQRLNLALADQVEELTQFRSDFFGRLRRVLGDREDIRIVGDRFVFQSEVLFGSGEAELGANGQAELAKLATTLKQIAADIPDEIPWVLQVDGHTDRRPISNFRFASNWELSAARAISVGRFLIAQGIPPERVAARGLAEFQPLDTGENEDAYRRNRRIEIKLTTR